MNDVAIEISVAFKLTHKYDPNVNQVGYTTFTCPVTSMITHRYVNDEFIKYHSPQHQGNSENHNRIIREQIYTQRPGDYLIGQIYSYSPLLNINTL